MGKNKHWVLLANALDETLLRNELTYYMGEQLGLTYTPKSIRFENVRLEYDINDDVANYLPIILGGNNNE